MAVSKTWSAGTVANGGTVTAHITATNPTGVNRTIIFQDTYDHGLSPSSLPGGCGVTSYTGYPMFFCHVSIPAFSSTTVRVPFDVTYTGPRQYSSNNRTHEAIDVQKSETYVAIPGQAQGKLFGTCLRTQTTNGGSLTISAIQSFSVNNFLPVGDVPSEFEATCPAGQTPVAVNLNGVRANTNYPNVHDALLTVVGTKASGGQSATVFAKVNQPTDTTLQWRCLKTTSSSGARLQFRVESKAVTVGPGQDKEVGLSCQAGEKGVIGGWYGGPLNGSEPRPVSRTYWFHNTSASNATYQANLLCVGSRLVKGGSLLPNATDKRCNYLGGVESPAETEYLNHDEACVLVKQGP